MHIPLLIILSIISGWLPVAIGFIRYRQLSFMFKQLFYLYLIGAVVDGISVIFAKEGISNMVVSNYYNAIAFIFYLWIFIPFLFPVKWKLVLTVLLIGTVALFLITACNNNVFERFNTPFIIIESLVLVLISLASLFRIVSKGTDLFTNGLFWTVSGMLIYFSVAFIVFGVYNILLQDIQNGEHFNDTTSNRLWNIHSIVNIIANLIYTYAFLCKLPRKILS